MTAGQVVGIGEVAGLLAEWFHDYDEERVDAWPAYFTADATYTARTDTGTSSVEDFVTSDLRGSELIMSSLVEHRRWTPTPLRHLCTNVHLRGSRSATEAGFACYLLVTQVVAERPVPVATGRCSGRVRRGRDGLRFAELAFVFDLSESSVRSPEGP